MIKKRVILTILMLVNLLSGSLYGQITPTNSVEEKKKIDELLKEQEKVVTWLTFAPDGKTLLSGDKSRTIKLWDLSTGKMIRSVTAHEEEVQAVDFAPDGKIFASVGGNDNRLNIWNAADGALLKSIKIGFLNPLMCVKFSPDGKFLAIGSYDGRVRVFSTVTWQILFELFDPNDGSDTDVESISISPDGKSIVVADSMSVKHWDLSTRSLKWKLGTLLAEYYNLETGKPVFYPEKWMLVAYSPDGRTIACASQGEIRLVDAENGKTIKTKQPFRAQTLAFTPDGKNLFFTLSFLPQLPFLEVNSFKLKILVEDKAEIGWPMAFSPNGKLVAGSVNLKVIKIWDVTSKKVVRIFVPQ